MRKQNCALLTMGSLRNNKYYSGFDPRNIQGCTVWLDATDVNGTGRNGSSGSAISTWVNKSGTSFGNFTQSTTSNCPVLSNISGYDVVKFNATSSIPMFLSNTTAYNYSTSSLYIVFQQVDRQAVDNPGIYTVLPTNSGGSDWNGSNGVSMTTVNNFSVFGNGGVVNINLTSSPQTYSPLGIYTLQISNNVGSGFFDGSPFTGQIDNGGATQFLAASAGQGIGARYISGAWSTNGGLNGYMCEVLLFTRFLQPSERQQIEGYLAWKWNIASRLQSPASISGLALWLDAADSSTLTFSGSNVTQWRDKSGNGRNTASATAGIVQGIPMNGRTTLNFPNDQFFTTPSFAMSAFTRTFFCVMRVTPTPYLADNTYYSLVPLSESPLNNNGLFYTHFRTNSPYTWNTTAGSYFGGGDWPIAGPMYTSITGLNSQPIMFTISRSAASTGYISYNGTSYTPSFTRTSGYSTTATAYNVPRNTTTGNHYFYGSDLCEILYYDAGLTTTQIQRIEGYLADKWGLQGRLPAGFPALFPISHPFYRSLPYTRAFNPLDINGCTLWLDGADGGSMTLSGSNITTWRDKSGNGSNATASGTPVFVQNALASNSVVSFNGTSYFTGTQTNTGTTQSTIAVVRFNSGGPQYARLASFGVNGSFDYNSASYFNLSSNTTQFAITRNSIETDVLGLTSDAYHIVTTIFNGTNGLYYVDGGMTSNSAAWSSAFNYNQYRIGADQIPTTAQQLQGSIGEFITYSNALSTTERQQLERYLGWKWNISNQINSPAEIGTLALWMDAADSNTLTLSGANVTAWRDKGANNLPLTLVGTPTWTSNSVNFTGTQYFTNTTISLNLSAMTVFLVGYNVAGITNGGGLLSLVPLSTGTDYNQTNAITYNFSSTLAQLYTTFNYTASAINANYTSPTNPILFTHVQNGTAMTLYSLGTSFYSTTTNFTPGTTTGLAIGARYQHGNGTASAYLYGTVKEIIVYNTALNLAQRQQVEKYLARKWGLTGSTSIPSSTLSLDIPPRISSYAPPQASNLSVWLDAADTTQVSLSGSNVAAWLDKSSNGLSMQSGASPTYVSNSLNGLPTIAFTTTQNLSSTTTLTLSPSNTWAVVFNAPSGGNYFMAEHSSNINNVQGSYFSGTNFDLYAMNRTGVLATWKRYQDSSGQGVPPFNPNTWYIAIVSDNNLNGGVFFRRNGVTRTISNVNTYGALTGNITSNFFVNHRLSAAVNIAELLVYNRGLSLAEVQTLEGYLASKWGLFSSLPTTHPYAKITP